MTKGNARGSGYDRVKNDWYVESIPCVEALFRAKSFSGLIHDPACGMGNIPLIARDQGYDASGADIVHRGFGEVRDFLQDDNRYDNIVTNPPFNLAEKFVLHALNRVGRHGEIAVLQRLAWLEGMGRYDRLFSKKYLRFIYAFSDRISMPPGGQKITAKGGSVAFAWFVFQRGGPGWPEFRWISSARE